MIRSTVVLTAVVLLAGCLRPGAGVERVSETTIDPDAAPSIEAVAVPQDDGLAIGGILAGVIGGGDDNADVPETDSPDSVEVDGSEAVEEPSPDADATEARQARRGLARLLPFGRRDQTPDTDQDQSVAEGAAEDNTVEPEVDTVADAVSQDDSGALAVETAEASDVEPEAPEAEARPRGLFARLRGNDRTASVEADDSEEATEEVTQVAAEIAPTISQAIATPDEPESEAEVTPVAARRTTLLGALRRGGGPATPAPGQDSITFGQKLPYGALATICNIKPALMGEQVAAYPERNPQYRIFDSAPGTLSLRTHYITGFKDGCARQFTAALAIFGGPGGHEATRYERSHRHIEMTRTDREYEALRARVCQAPVGSNCPDRRFKRLERNTVFVSLYERFGTNPRWADMLIHDGRVVAKDIKGD